MCLSINRLSKTVFKTHVPPPGSPMQLVQILMVKIFLFLIYFYGTPMTPCPSGQRRFNGVGCNATIQESLKTTVKDDFILVLLGDSIFATESTAVRADEEKWFPHCNRTQLKEIFAQPAWKIAIDMLKKSEPVLNVTLFDFSIERAPIIPIGAENTFGRAIPNQVTELRFAVEANAELFKKHKVLVAISVFGNDMLRFIFDNGRLPDVNLMIDIMRAQFITILKVIPHAEIMYHFPTPALWTPIVYETLGGSLLGATFIDSYGFGFKPKMYRLAEEFPKLTLYDPGYIPVDADFHQKTQCATVCGTSNMDWKTCVWADRAHLGYAGHKMIAEDIVGLFT